MSATPESPRIFISYTHDSPLHDARVLKLANDLRQESFDVDLDQFHANQDWPLWMEKNIVESTFVLVICTATYLRRWNNDERPGKGLGAQWESRLTRQRLYESPGGNNKFIPVVFDHADVDHIPTPLRNVTRVVLVDGLDHMPLNISDLADRFASERRHFIAPGTAWRYHPGRLCPKLNRMDHVLAHAQQNHCVVLLDKQVRPHAHMAHRFGQPRVAARKCLVSGKTEVG